MINRIVTRGMGPSRGILGRAGLVTQGYGGLYIPPSEIGRRVLVGGSAAKRRFQRDVEEFVVWVKLISVNDIVPVRKIEGFVRVLLNKFEGRVIVERVRNVAVEWWKKVRVTVKRLK